MKALRPRLGDTWQSMACQTSARASRLSDSSRQFRPLQHVVSKAAYTTQPFSGDSVFINQIFNQPSSRGPLSYGHAASGRQAHCARPFVANNTRNAGKGRASYSIKATVAEEPTIHDLFESKTGTWQYVVADPSTLTAVIIDPVLDYDPTTQVVTTQTADSLISLVREKGYKVDRILETHVHADHLTAASYLQNRLAQVQGYTPPIGIGKRIKQVQKLFGQRYGIPAEEYEGTFGKLFDDDETFNIGNLRAMAIHLPGHTPDHLGYKVGGKTSVSILPLCQSG
jgi:glyoxylase-like metal-dependent hydrolase (beta-lactamase superfamily II)